MLKGSKNIFTTKINQSIVLHISTLTPLCELLLMCGLELLLDDPTVQHVQYVCKWTSVLYV